MTEKQKQIVEDNHKLIYSFCHKNNLDIDEWYGILAIAFCEGICSYNEDRGGLSTYMYKIFNNAVKNEIRKNNAIKRQVIKCELEEVSSDFGEESYLKVLIDNLEPLEKRIVELRLKGYSQNEIAEVLNTNQPTICKLLARIKFKLRR